MRAGLAPLLVEALTIAGLEVAPPSFIEAQLEVLLCRLSDPQLQLQLRHSLSEYGQVPLGQIGSLS